MVAMHQRIKGLKINQSKEPLTVYDIKRQYLKNLSCFSQSPCKVVQEAESSSIEQIQGPEGEAAFTVLGGA